MTKITKSADAQFIHSTSQIDLFSSDNGNRRFFALIIKKPTKHEIENTLASKLLQELMKAAAIIQNAQNVMTPHQVQALASLNARDGIVGLHINRHHERRLLIAEAKEHYERASKKARLWRWLFRHTV